MAEKEGEEEEMRKGKSDGSYLAEKTQWCFEGKG